MGQVALVTDPINCVGLEGRVDAPLHLNLGLLLEDKGLHIPALRDGNCLHAPSAREYFVLRALVMHLL